MSDLTAAIEAAKRECLDMGWMSAEDIERVVRVAFAHLLYAAEGPLTYEELEQERDRLAMVVVYPAEAQP